MKYLLDTNVCIAFLAGKHPALKARMSRCAPDEVVLCDVVLAELWYGAEKSAKRDENLSIVSRFAHPFTCLPFDGRAARAYGRLRAVLERLGQVIGPNDLMIAAIAKANSLVLVTANLDEFTRVEGLKVENWLQP